MNSKSKNSNAMVILWKLLLLVKPLTHVMIITITLGSLGFLTAMGISILGGYAILNVVGFDTGITNASIFLWVILFAIILSISKYFEQLSGHFIAFKLLAVIRDKVFASLRKLAPAKLEGKDKGNMISILTADIELIEVFYAHTIAPVSQGIICSIIMASFIASFHYSLGIVAVMGYVLVGVVIPLINSKIGRSTGKEYRHMFGDLNSYMLESLRGLKEIIQYNQGDQKRKNIAKQSDALSVKNKKMKNAEGTVSAFTDLVILVSGLLVLGISVGLMRDNILGFDSVLISTIAMLGSYGPVIALSALSNDIIQTLASGERVINILEEKPMVDEIVAGKDLQVSKYEKIECDNVTFGYLDEVILKDVSLTIPKNKIIGIHGVSGSGKSTLLKLIMRFWASKEGQVAISDGTLNNVNEINTASLRKMESYVTQETYLFHDSIADNIRIAKLDATMDEIMEAARKASIHDFITALPNGYETQVSELGSSLSGGERQRIGIARSFLHDAPILLLDEPTSNLDSLNEGIILKALNEECKDKSVIIVSHRKSTLGIADLMYEMVRGRVS